MGSTTSLKIPNLNTFGTFLDRTAIEVVKRAQMQQKLNEVVTPKEHDAIVSNIETQDKLIEGISAIFMTDFVAALEKGDYSYYGELRTFSL